MIGRAHNPGLDASSIGHRRARAGWKRFVLLASLLERDCLASKFFMLLRGVSAERPRCDHPPRLRAMSTLARCNPEAEILVMFLAPSSPFNDRVGRPHFMLEPILLNDTW